MSNNNIYSFQKWKEFSIESPDETIFVSLQNIINNSDLDGNLKHKKESVYKVFSLIITHNYGYLIYELTHFLYYLNRINIPFYEVMILKPFSLKQKILTDKENVNGNQIEFLINGKQFNISLNRLPVLLVMLDFIEEYIGIKTLLSMCNQLEKLENNNDLKLISNKISKIIYEFMKDKLPSAHIQSYGQLISDELIIFKNEKFDLLNSDDVDDDFILNFWIRVNTVHENVSLKTFRTAFMLCLKYKHAMNLSKILNINNSVDGKSIDQWYEEKFYGDTEEDNSPWDNSYSKFETLADKIFEDDNKLEDGISFFEKLQEQNINLIKKNEIEELKIFSLYPDFLKKIPLSFIRNVIFSNLQNKIIESERRGSFEKYKENLLDFNNFNHYDIFLEQNNKLTKNLSIVKKIIFSFLWENNSTFCLELITYYLSETEKENFKRFISEYEETNSENLVNILNDFKTLFVKLDEEAVLEFVDFRKKLNEFEILRKSFRRKGLFDKNTAIKLNEIFYKSHNLICLFNETISSFRCGLKTISKLDNQFNLDFDIFSKNLLLIHGAK